MARVVQILSDFIRWRWAPFIGLVGASLFYVLFAILLIPSNVGASETEEEEAPSADAPESTERGEDSSETDAQTAPPSPVKHIERSSPLQAAPAPKRRGFSPPLERAEPAPPPPPVPPPAAPAVAEQVPPPPQAPPAPDPAAEEQQRLGAAAAARAATLAATRASRLSGRGLRPRMPSEVPAADAPVHADSELADDNAEESEAPADANAEQPEADDSEGDQSENAEPAEAEAEDE